MTMFKPSHPGSILKEDVLLKMGISVTEAASQLGVSRVALSRVVNSQAAISTDMAIRFEAWLNEPTAEDWLRMQAEYDLWHERQKSRPDIKMVKKRWQTIKKESFKSPAHEKSNTDFSNIDKAEIAQIKILGARFRAGRDLCKLTIVEAARSLEIDSKFLKKLEHGIDVDHVPLKLVRRASEVFDISVDFLFGGTDDWENSEEVKATREFGAYVHEQNIKMYSEWAIKQLAQERQLDALTTTVTAMLDEVSEMDTALLRFKELNKDFDVLPGGSVIQYRFNRARKKAHKARCLLVRCKAIPWTELNTETE